MIRIGQRTRVREVTGREEARAVVRKSVSEGGIVGWMDRDRVREGEDPTPSLLSF